MRRVLMLGIGNRYRSDDGVGPVIAERLCALGIPAEERSGEGADLIDAWQGYDAVIVVDACRSGATPGTVMRIDATAEPLPAGLFHYSSHLFGLAEAVETARALGRLPPRLTVFGIEGAAFGFGDTLSPAVEAAVDEVVRLVVAEVRASGP